MSSVLDVLLLAMILGAITLSFMTTSLVIVLLAAIIVILALLYLERK
jgi:hypothetical protein